jgi:hypothetical protein
VFFSSCMLGLQKQAQNRDNISNFISGSQITCAPELINSGTTKTDGVIRAFEAPLFLCVLRFYHFAAASQHNDTKVQSLGIQRDVGLLKIQNHMFVSNIACDCIAQLRDTFKYHIRKL